MTIYDEIRKVFDGGPGSGFENHAGRKGKIGGSTSRENRLLTTGKTKVKTGWENSNKSVQRDHHWRNIDIDTYYGDPSTQEQVAKAFKELNVKFDDAYEAVGQYKSINSYSSDDYRDIRQASKDIKAGIEPDPADELELSYVEDYIKNAPKWGGGNLHRGLKMSQERFDTIMSNIDKGECIDLGGPSSWSSNTSTADAFAGFFYNDKENKEVRVILHTNNKRIDKGTSIKHFSEYAHEDEVLVSQDALFNPTKIKKTGHGNTTTVHIYGDLV